MKTFTSKFGTVQLDDFFYERASKAIYLHKDEFAQYAKENAKLVSVKLLKDYTGGGLKECKDAIELYWEGKLSYVKEERKLKLEKLAKKPLVDQLIVKLRDIKEDKLHSLLMNLSVDELLSIDEFFPEE
jgi:hypothetical protein